MTTPASAAQLATIAAASADNAALAQRSFDAVVTIRRASERRSDTSHAAILNALEFILLWQFDLCTLQEEIAKNSGTFRGQLFVRCALLSIHASAHALKAVIGRDFRDQFNTCMGSEEWDGVLREAHSKAAALSDRCERDFRDARNAILAHRDHHPEIRLSALNTANERDVSDLMVHALAIFTAFGPAIVAYTEKGASGVEGRAT